MIDITTHLVETLRNSGIVAERFYPQAFPERVITPFIVYNGPNITTLSRQEGGSRYRIAAFQLTIYAVYEEAMRLLKDLICLFQDKKDISHPSFRLDRSRVTSTLLRYDPTTALSLADVFIEFRYVGD